MSVATSFANGTGKTSSVATTFSTRDYIREMVEVYLFRETEMSCEDLIIEQINKSTLDDLYKYVTKYNDSILHIAVYFKKHRIVTALLEKKMYVDYPNNRNETPLHYAAFYSCSEPIIDTLIKKGANVNAVTMTERYGYHEFGNFTPLRYAVSQGTTNTINCLVKNGAYITFHSISKCKRYIQEHTYSQEDFRMLIELKWSFMKEEYEKKLDYNLKLVIANVDRNSNIYVPKDLTNLIRSFMGYNDEEIEHIIREIEIEQK
jgi:ankyrin repeat protein